MQSFIFLYGGDIAPSEGQLAHPLNVLGSLHPYSDSFLLWTYWSNPIHKSHVNSSNSGFTPLSHL